MKNFLLYLVPLFFLACQPAAQETATVESDSLSKITAAAVNNNETSKSLRKKVKSLEKNLKAADGTIKDKPKAVEFIQAVKAFANKYPKKPEVPRLLSTAAETCRGIGAINEALALYGQVYQNYPEHALAPPALFIQGFILENELQQKEAAKKNYEKFMELYPDHEFAKTVKLNLQQIDMTPEELIKKFKQSKQQ